MSLDPFHERIADWLYADRVDRFERDNPDPPTLTLPARCKTHGWFEQHGVNADCPQCEAEYDRMARADAEYDLRHYHPGNATRNP